MIVSRRAFVATAALAALPARLLAVAPNASELGLPGMTAIADDIWVKQIDRRNWIFSATGEIGRGVVYPANGLVWLGAKGPVIVDPGWTAAQAEALIRWCTTRFKRQPVGAIVTHFHSDRAGGVPALETAGIPIYMTPLTRALLAGAKAPAPLPVPFVHDAFGLECFYPGGGHSPDNIVVWEKGSRILFGGCFLKSTTATDLGNLGDASVAAWKVSLARVAGRYPHASLIVPGHGLAKGDAIARTRELLAIGK